MGTATGFFATVSFLPSQTALAQKSLPKSTQDAKPFTSDDFTTCLSTQFQIIVDGALAQRMELSKVEAFGSNCQCCFTLVFKALHSTALLQNTYTIKHSKLGTFKMFMVPGEDAYGIWYVAVFERLHT